MAEKVRWVTPLGVETASMSKVSSSASRPSQTRTPVTEHDGDLHEVHVVDEAGSDEVAYDGGPATDAHVLAAGSFLRHLERFARSGVQEVEGGQPQPHHPTRLHCRKWFRGTPDASRRGNVRRPRLEHGLRVTQRSCDGSVACATHGG